MCKWGIFGSEVVWSNRLAQNLYIIQVYILSKVINSLVRESQGGLNDTMNIIPMS